MNLTLYALAGGENGEEVEHIRRQLQETQAILASRDAELENATQAIAGMLHSQFSLCT
jgi:hypothetical protein